MPTHVFAEDQFRRGQAANRRLLGLRAFTEAACEDRDLPLRWVPQATVTEFFTGYGSHPKGQKKTAVIRACQERGLTPLDDNESDALSIFFYAEAVLCPNLPRATGTLWARAG